MHFWQQQQLSFPSPSFPSNIDSTRTKPTSCRLTPMLQSKWRREERRPRRIERKLFQFPCRRKKSSASPLVCCCMLGGGLSLWDIFSKRCFTPFSHTCTQTAKLFKPSSWHIFLRACAQEKEVFEQIPLFLPTIKLRLFLAC